MGTVGFSAERKRVLAIEMCRELALEAKNPATSSSMVADKALAIAELLMDVDAASAPSYRRFTLIEGGIDNQSVGTAPRMPLLTVVEGSRRT